MSYKQWRITDPKILVTNPKILKIKVIKGLIINIRFLKNVIVMVFVLFFFFYLGVCCSDPELLTSPRVGVIPTPRSTSPRGSEDLCCPAGLVSSARKGGCKENSSWEV